ncbi:MAG: PASTA domain-containing protein [Polyangia bacterium]
MQSFLWWARTSALPVLSIWILGCSMLSGVPGMPQIPVAALANVEMPEVRGLPRAEAETRITTAGYLGSVDWREKECGLQPGIVCDTMPVSGVTIPQGTTIRVNVQQAVQATQSAPPGLQDAAVQMPDLVGKPVAEARQVFARQGISRVRYEEVMRTGCAAETVCETRTKAGERILKTEEQQVYVGKAAASAVPASSQSKPAAPAASEAKKPPPEKPRPANFF